MLVLKLILKRLCMGLFEKLLFRLRYIVGFALFALILWFLKVTILERIDTKNLDNIKSDQFKSFEEQNQPDRQMESNSAK
jgi:hypothetical protein